MQILDTGRVFSGEQRSYAERAAVLIARGRSQRPLACVITYGCQQNVSDSERIKGMLALMGYDFTDDAASADFILYNTCAVRAHAEDRVYGNIGAMKHFKRRNPNLILAVCGCMVQQPQVTDRIRKSFPYVDILFGTHVQHRLPEFLYRYLTEHTRVFETAADEKEIVEGVPIRRDSGVKGWLPVMYGCNNFCTYCIVPYVRGRERSREPEKILCEAKEMIAAGFKEITLLGQNVNSYGLGCDFGMNFAGLLRRINALPGDFRIRFMTSHPKDCTLELLDAMRDCEKAAHHLHLPFQSGSNRVLKRMNRRYTREEYLELVRAARERIPDISLTSDIIVGFPGETYEDFRQTLNLVKEVEFSSLFTFLYSPREGTPAAGMDDPVSREEKGKWFSELLAVQEEIAHRNGEKYIGRKERVICDDFGKVEGVMLGHTSGNATVEFEGDASLLDRFCDVEITAYTNILKGKLL